MGTVINTIPVKVWQSKFGKGKWTVTCGNSRRNTSYHFDKKPIDADLKDCVRKHIAWFN